MAARGVAFGDLQNDGFVDIAINCNDGPAVVLKNTGNADHWLMVDTIGANSNRDGIGAQLHLVSDDGKEQWAIVSTASSYLSASDKRVYFGLGHNLGHASRDTVAERRIAAVHECKGQSNLGRPRTNRIEPAI